MGSNFSNCGKGVDTASICDEDLTCEESPVMDMARIQELYNLFPVLDVLFRKLDFEDLLVFRLVFKVWEDRILDQLLPMCRDDVTLVVPDSSDVNYEMVFLQCGHRECSCNRTIVVCPLGTMHHSFSKTIFIKLFKHFRIRNFPAHHPFFAECGIHLTSLHLEFKHSEAMAIWSMFDLDYALSFCVNLEKLQLEDMIIRKEMLHPHLDQLQRMLLPRLTSLSLTNCCNYVNILLRKFISRCPRLKSLQLKENEVDALDKQQLIETITMSSSYINGVLSEIDFLSCSLDLYYLNKMLMCPGKIRSLKMSLKRSLFHLDPYNLIDMIGRHMNTLKILYLHIDQSKLQPDFTVILPPDLPHLEVLSINFCQDDGVFRFLRSCPRLTTLKVQMNASLVLYQSAREFMSDQPTLELRRLTDFELVVPTDPAIIRQTTVVLPYLTTMCIESSWKLIMAEVISSYKDNPILKTLKLNFTCMDHVQMNSLLTGYPEDYYEEHRMKLWPQPHPESARTEVYIGLMTHIDQLELNRENHVSFIEDAIETLSKMPVKKLLLRGFKMHWETLLTTFGACKFDVESTDCQFINDFDCIIYPREYPEEWRQLKRFWKIIYSYDEYICVQCKVGDSVEWNQ